VFADRRAVGTGAGTFAVARLRHRTDLSVTKHAHGFVPQTLADLGIVGVVLTTALLLAWLVAAARATALYPRRLPFRRDDGSPPERRDWTPDRTAVVALALIAIVFGLQSAIDWTWFVPGPTVMALVAAGFVAGRGPAAAVPEGPVMDFREPLREPSPARLLAAAAMLLTALLTAWAIWQPEAADRETGDAIALADAGDVDGALAKTRDAADTNPLSAEPLLVEAAIATQAGHEDDARRTLERAVLRFPGDAETWYRLAAFQLGTLDRADLAAETVRGALYLDPHALAPRQLFLEARASEREQQAAQDAR
jgi:tetratricopeptide (TPR) repeat protein